MAATSSGAISLDLNLNTDKLQQQVARFSSSLEDSLSSVSKTAGKTIENNFTGLFQGLTKSFSSGVSGIFSSFASGLKGVASGITKVLGTAGRLIGLGSAIVGGFAVAGGISRAMKLDEAENMVRTLGMDWDTAKESMLGAVQGTRFGLDAAGKSYAMLGAAGVQVGDQMNKSLQGIAGIATLAGDEMEDIANIFVKVASQGKLTGATLTQLSQHGVNALSALAQYFGVTQEAASNMVSNGQVSFEQFAEAMHKSFGDAAYGANNTFSGALANMGAALSRLTANFAAPALDGIRRMFVALIPVIDAVSNALLPLANTFGAVFNAAASAVESFSARIVSALSAVTGGKFSGITGKLSKTMGKLGGSTKSLASGAAGAANSTANLANSQGKAAKAAQAQNKAQKDLNKTLAGFDRINKLTSNSDAIGSTGGGSVGGGGGGISGGGGGIDLGTTVDDAGKLREILNDIKVPEKVTQAFDRLKESAGRLAEVVGKQLKWCYDNVLVPLGEWTINELVPDMLNGLADALDVLTRYYERIEDPMQRFINLVGEGLLWAYNEVLKPLASWTINEVAPRVLDAIATAFDVIVTCLEKLRPVAEWLWKNILKPVGEFLGDVFIWVLDRVNDALDWLLETVNQADFSDFIAHLDGAKEFLSDIPGHVHQIWENIKQGAITKWGEIKESIKTKATEIVTGIGEWFAGIPSKVSQWWKKTKTDSSKKWEDIKKEIKDKVDSIVKGVKEWFKNLPSKIAEIWENIKKAAAKKWEEIKQSLKKLWESLPGIAKGAFGLIGVAIGGAWSAISTAAGAAWSGITGLLGKAWDGLKTKASSSFSNLGSTISGAWNGIKNTASNAWNGISSTISGVWSKITGNSSTQTKNIQNSLNNIKGKSVTLTAVDKVSSTINAINSKKLNGKTTTLGAKDNASTSINNLNKKRLNNKSASLYYTPVLTKSSISIKSGGGGKVTLQAFAQGAFVERNTPRLAIIGDNRREGEYVAPESKFQRAIDEAAKRGGNAQVLVPILNDILTVLQDQDNGVYLDSKLITRSVVNNINQQVQSTGRNPILI